MGESRERKKTCEDWKSKWKRIGFAKENKVRLLGFSLKIGEKDDNLVIICSKNK